MFVKPDSVIAVRGVDICPTRGSTTRGRAKYTRRDAPARDTASDVTIILNSGYINGSVPRWRVGLVCVYLGETFFPNEPVVERLQQALVE